MSLLRIIDVVFIPFNDSDEMPFFSAIEDEEVEEINFMCTKSIPESQSNYTTITFIDKGIDGIGNTIIATLSNIDQNIVAFQLYRFSVNYKFVKNNVISVKKVDVGGVIQLGVTSFTINGRRI